MGNEQGPDGRSGKSTHKEDTLMKESLDVALLVVKLATAIIALIASLLKKES